MDYCRPGRLIKRLPNRKRQNDLDTSKSEASDFAIRVNGNEQGGGQGPRHFRNGRVTLPNRKGTFNARGRRGGAWPMLQARLSESDPIEKDYIERRISIILSTNIVLLINKIRHFLNYGMDYLGQGHFMSHLAAIFRPKLQPLSHYTPLNLSLIPLRYMPNEP